MKTKLLITILAMVTTFFGNDIPLKDWILNTEKSGKMILEEDTLILESLDNKYGASIYHNRQQDAKPGQAYRITVNVEGEGTLEAGLYHYGAKNSFLGRHPYPMPLRNINGKTEVEFYLQTPEGVIDGKEAAASYRLSLRVAKGKLSITSVTMTEVATMKNIIPVDEWMLNKTKDGSMTIENSKLVLTSLDNKYGATVYHKLQPAKLGQFYLVTADVEGEGTLEAGLYHYGAKNSYLGRHPFPMPLRKINGKTKVEFYLQTPEGVIDNKEVAASYRLCFRVAKGKVTISNITMTPVSEAPTAVNHLDTTHSVPGEILPLYSEPNLLKPKWKVVNGKMETKNSVMNLSSVSENESAILISAPIKVKAGEKYLLTYLYQTQNAQFGSFAQATIIPSSKVPIYLKQLGSEQIYSPFTGREIYNRVSGSWIRQASSYTPPNGVDEVNVVITQSGPPCDIARAGFYFGLGPWENDNRSKEYDWGKYVNNKDAQVSIAEALKIISNRREVTAEVKQADYPRIFINDATVPSLIYFGDYSNPTRSKLQDFRDAGVNLQVVVLSRWKKIWRGNKDYDFKKMDELIWDNVRRNPQGNFIVLLDVSPYDQWAEEFPREAAVDTKGKGAVSRHGRKGLPSYWSPVYRQQVLHFIKTAVEHMKKQSYFKIVGGIFLTGNEDGQFYYQVARDGVVEDGNSPGGLPEFRRWLKERYQTEKNLRKAWNNPSVTFENATPPTTEKRYPGNFFNPATQAAQIDLTRFLNESMGEFANSMCDTAKKTADKSVISIMWWGRGGSMMVYPHYAQTSKIFPSNALDLMGAQPGYQGERHAGSPCFYSWIPDSARINGKVTMIEADFRTWISPIRSLYSDTRVARFWNLEELSGALFRDLGRQLSTGGGLWFYDMTAGWFKDPTIMKEVKTMVRIAEKLTAKTDVFTPSEMVFIADEENYYTTTEQLGVWNGANFHTIRKNQRAMLRSGLKFDFYYFNDLIKHKMDNYKVYVFLNAFYLTAEKKDFIDKFLKKNGKTIVWLYAPGYLTENGFSADAMSELTGIRLSEDGNGLKNAFYIDSPLGDQVSGKRVGMDNKMGGIRFKVEDPKAVPLMRYTNNNIAGALREFKDWKSVYLGVPVAFTPEFLQNLAKYAGVQTYNTPGDMFIHRRDDLICLHGVVGNENIIRLPYSATLIDLVTGEKIIATSGGFKVKLKPGETKLLEIIKQ